MKNSTGRNVVIGIIATWFIASVLISNKNAYQKTLYSQKTDIFQTQETIKGYKMTIKEYEEFPKEHDEIERKWYRVAKEDLPLSEYKLETITPIYETNLEYYNSHWLLLRRPIIY